ncbi:hypothetical protein O9992_04230 [Vibrio lentus]|nr:hypothetical protein [Vibrio lentus]
MSTYVAAGSDGLVAVGTTGGLLRSLLKSMSCSSTRMLNRFMVVPVIAGTATTHESVLFSRLLRTVLVLLLAERNGFFLLQQTDSRRFVNYNTTKVICQLVRSTNPIQCSVVPSSLTCYQKRLLACRD